MIFETPNSHSDIKAWLDYRRNDSRFVLDERAWRILFSNCYGRLITRSPAVPHSPSARWQTRWLSLHRLDTLPLATSRSQLLHEARKPADRSGKACDRHRQLVGHSPVWRSCTNSSA